ncbi:hypothetical protein C8Q79DRAFT_204297 [Trametes meyenii]|nr:hypothetical protein C8Q79DRAFT_204297 [Trametes meyenii]
MWARRGACALYRYHVRPTSALNAIAHRHQRKMMRRRPRSVPLMKSGKTDLANASHSPCRRLGRRIRTLRRASLSFRWPWIRIRRCDNATVGSGESRHCEGFRVPGELDQAPGPPRALCNCTPISRLPGAWPDLHRPSCKVQTSNFGPQTFAAAETSILEDVETLIHVRRQNTNSSSSQLDPWISRTQTRWSFRNFSSMSAARLQVDQRGPIRASRPSGWPAGVQEQLLDTGRGAAAAPGSSRPRPHPGAESVRVQKEQKTKDGDYGA